MQSLWIRVVANMGQRKVTARLSSVLRTSAGLSRGASRAAAVGYLVMLWGSVAENTTDGRVDDVPDELLEDWAGWDGEPGAFARWLREHHVTDGRINDWDEYAGALEDRREKDRERKRRQRQREKEEQESPRDVRVTSARTNGNGTDGQNRELHTSPDGDVKGADAPPPHEVVTAAGGNSDRPPTGAVPPVGSTNGTAPHSSGEPASNGSGAPGTSLVVADPRYVTVQTATKGEAKTLAVVESRLAEIQAAVTEQRGRAVHDQQLMRYKIGVAFAYWAKITGHVRTALDAAAEALIRQHLKLAKADTVGDLGFLLYAVDGCQKSDWHMGRGPRGGDKHDWLKDILRDRQTAQELAERCGGYRRGDPHPYAVQYLAALTAPTEGEHGGNN